MSERKLSPSSVLYRYRTYIKTALYFCIAVLECEFVLAAGVGASPFRLLTVTLFSLSAGFLMMLVSSLASSVKVNSAIAIVILSVIAVLFIAEYMIKSTFSTFLDLDFILGNATDAADDFSDMVKHTILAGLWTIPVFAFPAIGFVVLLKLKQVKPQKLTLRGGTITVCIIAAFWSLGLVSVSAHKGDTITDREVYGALFETDSAVPRFGLLSSLRVNIKQIVFGKPEIELDFDGQLDLSRVNTPAVNAGPSNPPVTGEDPQMIDEPGEMPAEPTPIPVQIEYTPNVIYDFAAIAASENNKTLKQMAEYFDSVTPSMTNDYTGLFEGKNLIFMTLEAFSPWLVTEDLMPTMYKLLHESFVFNEYYQPAWGGSTSTGEWSNLTGFYPDGASAMKNSGSRDMTFMIGNKLKSLGYTSLAFHDNSYTYYSRNTTHKNLGYSDWIAIGSGLEMTNEWPRSDLEMFEKTMDRYIDNQPFNIYYMTVSGHANYNWTGNCMSDKNHDAVRDLPYSETTKAYIACNLELEYAMKYMFERLEAAGILDNTVIVMSPDHYPYGLIENQDKDYFSELAGHDLEKKFEFYKSCLVMYCSAIKEPVIIDEPTYSLDILPTLLNLFGIPFDSRLYTGRDVFSDAPALVLFPNTNFITIYGKYDAGNKKLIPYENSPEPPEGFMAAMQKAVTNKISIAKSVQRQDYFKYLKGK